jgi:hypothetical protein
MADDDVSLEGPRSLSRMNLLGMKMMSTREMYVRNGANELVPTTSVPWAMESNGNPHSLMFKTIKELLYDTVHVLFIIERDTNKNVVVYGLNKDSDGNVLLTTVVFWVMIPVEAKREEEEDEDEEVDLGNEGDQEVDLGNVYTEDLTFFENNYAYGIKSRSLESDGEEEHIYVKALEGQLITVKQDMDGEYYAMIHLNGSTRLLNRIFICTEPRLLGLCRTTEVHVDVRDAWHDDDVVTYYFKII